jgi:hypothetical protein
MTTTAPVVLEVELAPRLATGAPNAKSRPSRPAQVLGNTEILRAGEEIRTLDVNLGKVAVRAVRRTSMRNGLVDRRG